MIRHILCLTLVALLTAAIGAQTPTALSTGQKVELFKKNREIFDHVVIHTVESSKSPNDPLKRANSYYPLLLHFSQQISAAGNAQDNDRVRELSLHLTTLLNNGLAPTLTKAKHVVEGGTGVDEFRQVKKDLTDQLDALLRLEVVANNPEAKKSLDGTMASLNGIVIPAPSNVVARTRSVKHGRRPARAAFFYSLGRRCPLPQSF